MTHAKENLLLAEQTARQLIDAVEHNGLIVPGKKESELISEIIRLAKDSFGINSFWHKKLFERVSIHCIRTAAIHPTASSSRTTLYSSISAPLSMAGKPISDVPMCSATIP